MFFQKINLSCNRQIHHLVWTENNDNLYIGPIKSCETFSLYRKYNLYCDDLVKLYVDTGNESYTLNFSLEGGNNCNYKSDIIIELKFSMIDNKEELNIYIDGEYSTI